MPSTAQVNSVTQTITLIHILPSNTDIWMFGGRQSFAGQERFSKTHFQNRNATQNFHLQYIYGFQRLMHISIEMSSHFVMITQKANVTIDTRLEQTQSERWRCSHHKTNSPNWQITWKVTRVNDVTMHECNRKCKPIRKWVCFGIVFDWLMQLVSEECQTVEEKGFWTWRTASERKQMQVRKV